MKNDFQEWLSDLGKLLLALLVQLGYWFGEVGSWLVTKSEVLDAVVKLLMALILFAYFLKVFFGVNLPLVGPFWKKFKRFFKFRKKQLKTIDLIDSEFETFEETAEKTKEVSITLWILLKKGLGNMKRFFAKIGKFLYRNKFTLLGFLSLAIIAVSVFLRIMRPELINGFIGDREFFAGLTGLFGYSAFALGGYGVENEEAWKKRNEEKWAREAYEKEQRKRLKEELRQNKLINSYKKEIEKEIVPVLRERLKEQAISGIQKGYRSLTDIFPDLKLERIKIELGNDETRIGEFIEDMDKLAEQYGLLEETVINGVKQYVNLILEEIQK